MADVNTFLTTLYVWADDFCKTQPMPRKPGPLASITRSEIVALVTFGQWRFFATERGFYRYATRNLRGMFPNLPNRSQYNRLTRHHWETIAAFGVHLGEILGGTESPYEALDTYGAVTRNAKRRGEGWLVGIADIGWSTRVGWYEGLRIMTSVNPVGVITGFGVAPGSAKEQPMAETFFNLRSQAEPQVVSVGRSASGCYLADKGFEGEELHIEWGELYEAYVITAPRRDSKNPWPKELRRRLASLRQIVETVHDKLHNMFGLNGERPHDLLGFQARLSAKVALHNFCILMNRLLGRRNLAFADLIDW